MITKKSVHQALVEDAKKIGKPCFVCVVFPIANNRLSLEFFESFVIKDVEAFNIPAIDTGSVQALNEFANYDYTKNYFVLVGYQIEQQDAQFIKTGIVPFNEPEGLMIAITLFFKELFKTFPNLQVCQ